VHQSAQSQGFLLVVAIEAFTIGPMSADQHYQIGIRRVATSFRMRTDFINQSENFEKSQKLEGRSEKFKN
jgi:hypothetical protein